MPARTSAPPRDLDYTNIGKVGRRTGITLPPRKRDEHGLEEMTGLFSSPEKPRSQDVASLVQTAIETPAKNCAQTQTPPTAISVRRSVRNSARSVRSLSPRKSGISGSARRSGAVNVLAVTPSVIPTQEQMESVAHVAEDVIERAETSEEEEDEEVTVEAPAADVEAAVSSITRPLTTPAQSARAKISTVRPATVRRFSPERTPQRNNVRKSKSAYVPRVSNVQPTVEIIKNKANDLALEGTPTRANTTVPVEDDTADIQDMPEMKNGYGAVSDMEEDVVEASPVDATNAGGLDDVFLQDQADQLDSSEESEAELEPPPLPPAVDDEDADQTFSPSMLINKKRGQNKANSRRKRKSDFLEGDRGMQSSPVAKRAKRRDGDMVMQTSKAIVSRPSKATSTRPALVKKDKNTQLQLSQRRQEELDDVVQKIRARPGPKKSLYVLRRETPMDDTVSRTRSGRVTIKPVAWWRNEGIEYDAGDGVGNGIDDGWRFPMRSIKQVIRQEEKVPTPRPKKKGAKKGEKRPTPQEEADLTDSGYEDPDADNWELDSGTLTVPMGVWDPELQDCADEEEEVDIAHAAEAIETREIKGQGFRYAKLISQTFFGVGIVDLPAGAVKKVKNSKKMHMSFFVFKGRVTVQTGPISGPGTRFSIGKGGFWHVPRGNNYSIENEHNKPARIFFSQACDTAPLFEEED